MKKNTVIAELKYLKTKLYGRRIHELINSIAVIEAICSETSEEEISPIFQCIVEKELSKIREAVRR